MIKLSAKPLTVSTMSEYIGVPLDKILTLEQTLGQAADAAIDMMLKTMSGRLIPSEVLRHNEFVLTKLYRSA